MGAACAQIRHEGASFGRDVPSAFGSFGTFGAAVRPFCCSVGFRRETEESDYERKSINAADGAGLPLLLPVWFGLDGLIWFMAAADVLAFAVSAGVLARTGRNMQ